MRNYFAMIAVVGLIASLSLVATAADSTEPVNPFDEPSMGNRNVFARVSDEPDSEEQRGFSFPKLSLPKPKMPNLALPKLPSLSMPQWAKRKPATNSGPSTWQKLNTGTKNMFSKTRDTLMPWSVNHDAPPVRNATGSLASTGMSRTRVASNRGGQSSTTPDGEKKSIFSSFLPTPEPEEQPIRTTSDFLSQKRPSFD